MTQGAGAHLARDTVLVVVGVIGILGLLFMFLRRSRLPRAAGFGQSFLLRGGMKEWSAQQLPVARRTPERVAGSPTTMP